MFRPVMAIIKFLPFATIKIFPHNSRDGVLIRRSQHQSHRWSTVLLYYKLYFYVLLRGSPTHL